MAIRTFKNATIRTLDGNVITNGPVNLGWANEGTQAIPGCDGLSILIDSPMYASRKVYRRICFKCGAIEDNSDNSCQCSCGNKNFHRVRIDDSRYYRAQKSIFEGVGRVIDGKYVTKMLNYSWDIASESFKIDEKLLELFYLNDKGFACYNLNDCPYGEKEDKLFKEYVHTVPWLEDALILMEKYPLEGLVEYDFDTTYIRAVASYHNILLAIPGIDTVSSELFYALITRFVRDFNNRVYDSIEDFYVQNKIPRCLADIYPIIGVPNQELDKIDTFDKSLVNAISYSLTHHYISYYELNSMLRYENAAEMNAYANEFGEFFRKNVVRHGSKVYSAFLYVKSERGCKTIKDANLIKASRYFNKKGIKPKAVDKYCELMSEGDPIEALKALL